MRAPALVAAGVLLASCEKPREVQSIPASDEYARKLLSPDWRAVEEHFGTPMPRELKDFYADPGEVLQVAFELQTRKPIEGSTRVHVETFSPIDQSSCETFEGYERFLQFASDGSEGLYHFDTGEEAPEVIYFIMDGGDSFPTGLSLAEFLSAPRRPAGDGHE